EQLLRSDMSRDGTVGTRSPVTTGPRIPLDDRTSVLQLGDGKLGLLLHVSHPDQRWLVDLDGQLQKMPLSAQSVWSAAMLPERASGAPFLDRNGHPDWASSELPYPVLIVSDSAELLPVSVHHSLRGGMETQANGHALALHRASRRLEVAE